MNIYEPLHTLDNPNERQEPRMPAWMNTVFFKDCRSMSEIPDSKIDLIVTSPPYFNIKDYSLDGYQLQQKADKHINQIGDIPEYSEYINELLAVWNECHRVLKPNGKLIINVPLMPMLKKQLNTHYNRHIFDLDADIKHSIINGTQLFLYDTYIWNRTNPSKKLMFGSYPYPRNFYAQNTVEFISVYVKDGKSMDYIDPETKRLSMLSEAEWVEYTKQIWDIPIPNKTDIAFGLHPAIMPEEIALRCIRLFTFTGDVVLDPFAGSGTTLKVAKELDRNYVGYEIMESYRPLINQKLESEQLTCL